MNDQEPPDDLVSSAEVRALLGVSRSRVGYWGRCGWYGARKIGREWFFERTALPATLRRAPESSVEVPCAGCGRAVLKPASVVRKANDRGHRLYHGACWAKVRDDVLRESWGRAGTRLTETERAAWLDAKRAVWTEERRRAQAASVGPEQIELLHGGHREWRATMEGAVANLKAAGLLDVDDVVSALPRELRRSRATVRRHIADGRLVPTPNEFGRHEFGRLLFSEAAVADYIAWLRGHPDGRLSRFNATTPERARFRGEWYRAHHDSEAEFGRLATLINRAGPKVKTIPEEEARIRELRAKGKTLRQIVISLQGDVTLKQVRRVLATQGD